MMMMMLLLLLFATCAVSHAAVYYVATTGNDSAPGTQAQPWKTISHAAGAVSTGDTVVVGDGTYVETVHMGHSGTSGSRITFQAQNKWRATIAPTATQLAALSQIAVDINAAYVTFQNFEVMGPSDGSAYLGIKCNGGDYCNVIGNKVHQIGVSTASCPSGAAIEIASNNDVVNGNYIYNVSPPRTAGFRCNHEQGLYITAGNNGTFRNNIIFECWQCVALQLDGGSYSNWTISNNTIFNVGDTGHSSGAAIYFNCYSGTCDNNIFNNNTFDNVQNMCIQGVQGAGGVMGTHNQYADNLFNSCAGGNTLITGSLSGSVNADPLFVNYTGDQTGDYHLQSGSAAIKAGTTVGASSTDFDGSAQTSPPTIGALLQASGSGSLPAAPTALTAAAH